MTNRQTTLALILVLFLSCACSAAGQPGAERKGAEVSFRVASAEILQFAKPIRLGAAEDPGYREALVVTVSLSRTDYEALPPSLQPYLYIGDQELFAFEVRQGEEPGRLVMTFHAPDWQDLRDGAPMVLTVDRGAPVRDPERFVSRQDLPRFNRRMVVDRRPPS